METTKECFKCHEVKPLSEFYKHGAMSDGHLNKCKACTKADSKANYRRDPSARKQYEKKRNKTAKRREQLTEASRKHRQSNPERYKARTAVSNALRDGRLEKGPCEGCGTAERVQAHHEDYSKPLEVRWLCKQCHDREHGTSVR